MVKKAVVLAAGHGTRLRPFTCATPKPLMPVWGEPMLARIVALLRERGVDDIVVNAHHLNEQVRAWVDDYRRKAQAAGDRVRIKVSYEPEILGNGGVLNPLREWIGEENFYLVSSDIVLENVPDMEAAFAKCAAPSVLGCCLTIDRGPRTIEVEPESGFVTCWKSIDPGVEGTYTYIGLAILKPAILNYVKPEGFSSIVTAFERAMAEGKFMRAVTAKDLMWEDAGTILSYIDLNRDGDDNAFADIPQLKATGAKDFRFLSARGSDRVFFGCDKGIAVLYDDGKSLLGGYVQANDTATPTPMLTKLNAQGRKLWTRTYEKGGKVTAMAVDGNLCSIALNGSMTLQIDELGYIKWDNIAEGCRLSSVAISNGVSVYTGVKDNAGYAMAINANGQKQWETTFEIPADGTFTKSCVLADGSVVSGGTFGDAVVLVKVDAKGTATVKTFNGGKQMSFNGIATATDNDVWVSATYANDIVVFKLGL